MKNKLLKILLSVVLVIILAVIYLRSGKTYYKNTGFGGPELTFRFGSFSYKNWSDVGYLDRAVGFINPFDSKIVLIPILFLSSDEPFHLIFNKPFIQIRCGERDYLVLEKHKEYFFEWTTKYKFATSTSVTTQPHFILEGDEKKKFGDCSIQR